MIKKSIKILLAIIGAFSIIYSQEDCYSRLIIETNINDSQIFIDSVLVAEGRLDTSLETGMYRIFLLESRYSWNGNSFKDSIHIEHCNETISMNYDFEKTVVITSTPDDAVVVHSDSILGYTPLKTNSTLLNFTLTKDGFSNKQISLQQDDRYKDIVLQPIEISRSIPFTKTTLFKILIGSAVALGATAAYLKIEADENFDKYLETRQGKFLDDTDKYDLYSGLAFGALQLNFGALLYFFLFE